MMQESTWGPWTGPNTHKGIGEIQSPWHIHMFNLKFPLFPWMQYPFSEHELLPITPLLFCPCSVNFIKIVGKKCQKNETHSSIPALASNKVEFWTLELWGIPKLHHTALAPHTSLPVYALSSMYSHHQQFPNKLLSSVHQSSVKSVSLGSSQNNDNQK